MQCPKNLSQGSKLFAQHGQTKNQTIYGRKKQDQRSGSGSWNRTNEDTPDEGLGYDCGSNPRDTLIK